MAMQSRLVAAIATAIVKAVPAIMVPARGLAAVMIDIDGAAPSVVTSRPIVADSDRRVVAKPGAHDHLCVCLMRNCENERTRHSCAQ